MNFKNNKAYEAYAEKKTEVMKPWRYLRNKIEAINHLTVYESQYINSVKFLIMEAYTIIPLDLVKDFEIVEIMKINHHFIIYLL
jgi:hypothetical protein